MFRFVRSLAAMSLYPYPKPSTTMTSKPLNAYQGCLVKGRRRCPQTAEQNDGLAGMSVAVHIQGAAAHRNAFAVGRMLDFPPVHRAGCSLRPAGFPLQ